MPNWGSIIEKPPGGSGGSISIGDAVGSGLSGGVLYVDAAGKLAQDQANFFYNAALIFFGIGAGTNPRQKLDFGDTGGNIALGRFQNIARNYSIGIADNSGDFGTGSQSVYMSFYDEGDGGGTSILWTNSDISGNARQVMQLDRLGDLNVLASVIVPLLSVGTVNASGTINATSGVNSNGFAVNASGDVSGHVFAINGGNWSVDAGGNVANSTSTTTTGRLIVPSILADGTYTIAGIGSITMTNGAPSGTS